MKISECLEQESKFKSLLSEIVRIWVLIQIQIFLLDIKMGTNILWAWASHMMKIKMEDWGLGFCLPSVSFSCLKSLIKIHTLPHQMLTLPHGGNRNHQIGEPPSSIYQKAIHFLLYLFHCLPLPTWSTLLAMYPQHLEWCLVYSSLLICCLTWRWRHSLPKI